MNYRRNEINGVSTVFFRILDAKVYEVIHLFCILLQSMVHWEKTTAAEPTRKLLGHM